MVERVAEIVRVSGRIHHDPSYGVKTVPSWYHHPVHVALGLEYLIVALRETAMRVAFHQELPGGDLRGHVDAGPHAFGAEVAQGDDARVIRQGMVVPIEDGKHFDVAGGVVEEVLNGSAEVDLVACRD
jgi:hypothetical protein